MTPSRSSARALLVLAAVLWSSGSLFSRLLTEDTGLGLESPGLTPIQIAFWRGLFAHKDTPAPVVAALRQAVAKVARSPAFNILPAADSGKALRNSTVRGHL